MRMECCLIDGAQQNPADQSDDKQNCRPHAHSPDKPCGRCITDEGNRQLVRPDEMTDQVADRCDAAIALGLRHGPRVSAFKWLMRRHQPRLGN